MVPRPFWIERIREEWKRAPVVWLSGVRRVGKTTLAKSIPAVRYLNCDLPSVAELLHDPESFYASVNEEIVVFDEVHQLPDPSRLLKIGADAFPHLKILATGSSTLSATKKFRDSLTGRKREVQLLPVLAEELDAFGIRDLRVRLFRGGLPQALLSGERDPESYAEWLDSFFARDIQELFRVEKRAGFLHLLEVLLRQSGGLIEVTNLAKATGLSRPTVMNYLNVLEVTHAIHILRPYHAGGRQELLQQPKVYGFDTGFVVYTRGWGELRSEDCGTLLEHLVLDTLRTLPGTRAVQFWRDKQHREVDFVLPRGRGECDAIECKWRSTGFDPKGLLAFRKNYARGRTLVVASDVRAPYTRKPDGLEIQFVGLGDLRAVVG